MILLDVNVLIYAHREQAPDHARYRNWLNGVVHGPQAYGYAELVLSGFIRVVTNPRVFIDPTPTELAIAFVEHLRSPAHAVRLVPGSRHWNLFVDLCRVANARANLIPDAYFAALAIESGSEWITTDRDYARFPGLRWRHPFA
jgi:uncharacterized protein